MKLEAGKKYVPRYGNKVYGPLFDRRDLSNYDGPYPFECPIASESWAEDGSYHDDGHESDLDLVAEYREAVLRRPVLDPDGLEVGPVVAPEGPIAKLHRELKTFDGGCTAQDLLLDAIGNLLDCAADLGYDLDETLKRQGQE